MPREWRFPDPSRVKVPFRVHRSLRSLRLTVPLTGIMRLPAVLNQGDQGENLIPPSLILIPDIPDIPEVPWVPSGACLPDIRDP